MKKPRIKPRPTPVIRGGGFEISKPEAIAISLAAVVLWMIIASTSILNWLEPQEEPEQLHIESDGSLELDPARKIEMLGGPLRFRAADTDQVYRLVNSDGQGIIEWREAEEMFVYHADGTCELYGEPIDAKLCNKIKQLIETIQHGKEQ